MDFKFIHLATHTLKVTNYDRLFIDSIQKLSNSTFRKISHEDEYEGDVMEPLNQNQQFFNSSHLETILRKLDLVSKIIFNLINKTFDET